MPQFVADGNGINILCDLERDGQLMGDSRLGCRFRLLRNHEEKGDTK